MASPEEMSKEKLDSECRKRNPTDSFILEFESRVFDVLSWFSLFGVVRRLIPKRALTYAFVDAWVIANLVASIVAIFLIGIAGPMAFLILLYGGFRVLETVIYQANVFIFDEYRAKRAGRDYRLRGYRRLVLLSMHNYIELVFWFAVAYRYFHTEFAYDGALRLHSKLGAIYFSLVTWATVGFGDIHPTTRVGAVLVISQIAIGVFMALVILTRFISHLPRPATQDPDELGA